MTSSIGRIATVLVQSARANFQDENHAGDWRARLGFLRKCAEVAQQKGCQTLVLPAGLFFVPAAQRQYLEGQVLGVLADFNLITAFGIDEGEKTIGGKSDKFGGQSNVLPNFGYIHEGGRFLVGPVRQTDKSVDHNISSPHVNQAIAARLESSTLLGGRTVALALCGELLSAAWRAELVRRRPDLLFHPAHASVPLGRRIREAWGCHLDDLLRQLPATSIWIFADHTMSLQHCANGARLPLVRHGGGRAAQEVLNCRVANSTVGQLYVYNV